MTDPITAPLRIHPNNPHDFADAGRHAIYPTGSHTWADLQDIGRPDDEPFFA